MSEFEDYLHGESKVDSMTNPYDAAREVWQHQQAKIDELQNKIESLKHTSGELLGAISLSCASYLCENKKLKGRIDIAMEYVSESPLKDVSRRAMINFMDILKGDKDETGFN